MKVSLSPMNKFNVALSALFISAGVVLTIVSRSWMPLVFFSGILIIPAIAGTSIIASLEIVAGKKEWDKFSSIHFGIAFASLAFLLIGMLSVVERIVWFNAAKPPSIIVAKTYGDNYTANKHRRFKFNCESRGVFPWNLREVDDRVYVRCGEMYPNVYTISVPTKEYLKVEEETRNDPPHMGYVLENE